MSEETPPEEATLITVQSSRFGPLEVPEDSVIHFPNGIIGFPRAQNYIMIEHKPPFSWLHSVDDSNLAFVVVDGFQFGDSYDAKAPIGDRDCDFKADDEFAILIIVTVRPDPRMTTANLKAPIFVNMRNRKGTQIIIDDQRYSTRHALWQDESEEQEAEEASKTEPTAGPLPDDEKK